MYKDNRPVTNSDQCYLSDVDANKAKQEHTTKVLE